MQHVHVIIFKFLFCTQATLKLVIMWSMWSRRPSEVSYQFGFLGGSIQAWAGVNGIYKEI